MNLRLKKRTVKSILVLNTVKNLLRKFFTLLQYLLFTKNSIQIIRLTSIYINGGIITFFTNTLRLFVRWHKEQEWIRNDLLFGVVRCFSKSMFVLFYIYLVFTSCKNVIRDNERFVGTKCITLKLWIVKTRVPWMFSLVNIQGIIFMKLETKFPTKTVSFTLLKCKSS